MIFSYLLIAVMPFVHHSLWNETMIADITLNKYLGMICFLLGLVHYGARSTPLHHLRGPRPCAVESFTCTPMRACTESRLATGAYDAVVSGIFTAVNLLPVTPPPIIDFQDAEHVIVRRYTGRERNPLKRAYARVEYRKMRGWEREVCHRSRAGMACSAVDRDIVTRLCPSLPVTVVSNIVDVPTWSYGEEDPVTVLFQGGMDWYPNRDAVEFFASAILPALRARIPAVRFVVAGRNPSPAFRRRLEDVPALSVTGTVKDMRPVVAMAAVCVVWLRMGTGTRLKILEAAAMARLIVSTAIGAEGLDFADGRDILLADDPRSFAHAVAHVLSSPELRAELGTQARRVVETRYAFANLRAGVRAALNEAVHRADACPPPPAGDGAACAAPGRRLPSKGKW